MAQYLGGVQGNRGGVSRLGSKSSGIQAYAQGWHVGVSVSGGFDEKTGHDSFMISANGGSNGRLSSRPIAEVTLDDQGQYKIEHLDKHGYAELAEQSAVYARRIMYLEKAFRTILDGLGSNPMQDDTLAEFCRTVLES